MNIPFSPENIKTEADIKTYFIWLVDDQFLNFHCDTPFEDYVYHSTNDRVYTDEEAALLNAAMDRCFEIKEDVYEIGMAVIKEYVFPEIGADYDERDEKAKKVTIRKYSLHPDNTLRVAATIAQEVIVYGKSTGWQGKIRAGVNEVLVLSDILKKYNILCVDDMYGTWKHYPATSSNPEK